MQVFNYESRMNDQEFYFLTHGEESDKQRY